MNLAYCPSAAELRRAEAARDNTSWTAEQASNALKIPLQWMRTFYAEGGR